MQIAGPKLAIRTASEFFNHILRLPVAYFSQRFAGEIGSRVLINDKVANVVSGKLATTALDCLLIVFYAILMLVYDVWLTLLVIAIALLNIVAVRVVARRRIDGSRKLMLDQGKLMGTAMNGLRMIETLKATGSESEFFSRWAGYQAKALRAEQFLGLLGELVSSVPPFVNTLTTTVVLLVGGLKVMHGDLTVGMLVAYQTLVGSFTRPLNSFVQFGSTLQELEADMNRLDDVLRYPQDRQYTREAPAAEAASERRAVKLAGEVELRNVTFGYSPLEAPLIENFSLLIKPGQRIALVGASGSGKSTVAKLVSGLYEPWEGEVLFDGTPRDKLPRSLVSNSIGLVDQDIFLFGGTIRDNVTMWDSTIPLPSVTQACRDAEINGVIEAREGTYGALVSEGGANFSGGQRQRLEIALRRAHDPDPRRGDERARPEHRGLHRRQPPPARLHLHHHRPPPEHDSRRGRDHHPRAREDRAARHARRDEGRGRQALREAHGGALSRERREGLRRGRHRHRDGTGDFSFPASGRGSA